MGFCHGISHMYILCLNHVNSLYYCFLYSPIPLLFNSVQCIHLYAQINVFQYYPHFIILFFSHLPIVPSDRPTITIMFSLSLFLYIYMYICICVHICVCIYFLCVASIYKGKHATFVLLILAYFAQFTYFMICSSIHLPAHNIISFFFLTE
jgi:hypothetical protein